jgi:hypothetical protein
MKARIAPKLLTPTRPVSHSPRVRRLAAASIARLAAAALILFTLAAPPFAALSSAERISTFATDCATAKSAFNLGDTVCAVATGAPLPANGFRQRRFEWVAPDGMVTRQTDITTDPQRDSFTIPASGQFAQAGKWTVKTVDNSAEGYAIATFVVQKSGKAD